MITDYIFGLLLIFLWYTEKAGWNYSESKRSIWNFRDPCRL